MNLAEYDRMRRLEDRYWWFVARRALAKDLLRQALPDPGGRLLDLGCGPGALLSEMEGAWTTVGLDVEPLALKYCRERGLPRLVLGDGQKLPFRDGSFDAVTALDAFEHIPDDVAAFTEVARVLRPGGALVLSVPAYKALWGPHDVALHHQRRYTLPEIEARLRSAGLTVEVGSYAIHRLFPAVLAARLRDKFRRGVAEARLPEVSDRTNDLLGRIVAGESRRILAGARLPWGSSVVAVARRGP